MSLGERDLPEILKLLEQSPWDELRLETPSFKLTVSKRSVPPHAEASEPRRFETPAAAAEAPRTPEPRATAKTPPAGAHVVTAPTLGNFYVAPKPGAAPFVRPGDRVGADATVAIVEVMKLMNQIPAGIPGTILEVLPANGDLVEYGQPLVWIEPAE